MASHVVVIDTTFRRATIKVTPGTFMSDILDEACGKLNLKASNYGLKNNNKPVDVSRTFRQTGLSSGAKLELVVASRSPSVVSVALQLPQPDAKEIPGGRLTHKFPSTTTLWLILRAFESNEGRNLNFTGRGVAQTDAGATGAGRIFYETPVLNIMGRELSTFQDLQKTLAQLGLNSGSSLIRLNFRQTDRPLEEAMVEIGSYFRSTGNSEDIGAPNFPTVTVESNPTVDGVVKGDYTEEATPEATSVLDVDSPMLSPDETAVIPTPPTPSEALKEDIIVGPNQRPIKVFAAPSSDTPRAALTSHNEADYEPTLAHATLHQQRLLSRSQNQRLPSDAEAQVLAEERVAKQAAVKEVSIKVRFPDQSSVVAEFTPVDTGLTFYQHVRDMISAEDQPFLLVWMTPRGPQTVPDDADKRLIKDLGFSGRMLVNVNWGDSASDEARKGPTLKAQYARQAQELKVQEIATAEAQEEEEAEAAKTKEEHKKMSVTRSKDGMPKWFKGLGKK